MPTVDLDGSNLREQVLDIVRRTAGLAMPQERIASEMDGAQVAAVGELNVTFEDNEDNRPSQLKFTIVLDVEYSE